jgi:hypothetical protein
MNTCNALPCKPSPYSGRLLISLQEKMIKQVLNKSLICVRCYHTREFHITDKDGYDYCKKCSCNTFEAHTTEVFEC